MEPFFTPQGVRRFEPNIAEEARVLDRRLLDMKGTDTVVHLHYAMSAYAGDIISRMCCGTSYKLLEDPAFAPDW